MPASASMSTRIAGLGCRMAPSQATTMMPMGSPATAPAGSCALTTRAQCPDDVQYLYAWKVARHCNGEDFCLELKAEFVDMDGQPYECNLYDWYGNPSHPPLIGPFDLDAADIYVNWRAYVEPATNVGPDDNETPVRPGDLFRPVLHRAIAAGVRERRLQLGAGAGSAARRVPVSERSWYVVPTPEAI